MKVSHLHSNQQRLTAHSTARENWMCDVMSLGTEDPQTVRLFNEFAELLVKLNGRTGA